MFSFRNYKRLSCISWNSIIFFSIIKKPSLAIFCRFYSQICIFRRKFITSLNNLFLQFLKCSSKLLFVQTSSQFWQLFWSNLSFWGKIPLIHLITQKIIHRILRNNLRWLIRPMSSDIQGHSFWISQISTWSSQKSIFMNDNRSFFFINFYILLNRRIQSNIWFCKQLIQRNLNIISIFSFFNSSPILISYKRKRSFFNSKLLLKCDQIIPQTLSHKLSISLSCLSHSNKILSRFFCIRRSMKSMFCKL